MSSFINLLFTLLDDETVAWDAARALGALVADGGALTKRNGAILKVSGNRSENVARCPHFSNPDSSRSKICRCCATKGSRWCEQRCWWVVKCPFYITMTLMSEPRNEARDSLSHRSHVSPQCSSEIIVWNTDAHCASMSFRKPLKLMYDPIAYASTAPRTRSCGS